MGWVCVWYVFVEFFDENLVGDCDGYCVGVGVWCDVG